MTPRPALLDTTLLVLFVVGQTSVRYIEKHRSLQGYSKADYDLVLRLLELSSELVLTPNILSEASNFLERIMEPARTDIMTTFGRLLERCREIYIASREAATKAGFSRLGLADSISLLMGNRGTVIITTDLALYVEGIRLGYEVINFAHVREAFLDGAR